MLRPGEMTPSYFPVASSSRGPDRLSTIVQPLDDDATVPSQPARTPAGSPPVTMSRVGQSFGATGEETGDVEERWEELSMSPSELPPEYVLAISA